MYAVHLILYICCTLEVIIFKGKYFSNCLEQVLHL